MEGEEEGFLSLVRVQQCRMSQMERVTVLELGTRGKGILGWLSLNVTKAKRKNRKTCMAYCDTLILVSPLS